MKKLTLLFCLFLAMGAFIYPTLKKERVKHVAVLPNGRHAPNCHPFDEYYYFRDMAESKGYTAEWLDLKKMPKKHEYIRRMKHALFKEKPAFINIFHNYHAFTSKAKIDMLPKGKRILIMWEPPSVLMEMYGEPVLSLFDKVYTWNDDLVDNKKFFKMCYNVLRPMKENLPSFHKRKLLCMMNSNLKFNDFEHELYSTRRMVARFFDRYPEGVFDLYGSRWEGYRHAKGRVPSKLDTIKNYKFNVCFENTHQKGYITEKIFDCFEAGTVPIYYGATNVEDYIPKECFIDYRQFNGPEEMLAHVQSITEEEYLTYVENIRSYLESDQAQQFSSLAFAKKLMQAIED